MDMNIESVPTDNMPWDKPYNQDDLIADARRYRTLIAIGPRWYREIWNNADSSKQFDELVDAAKQQIAGM